MSLLGLWEYKHKWLKGCYTEKPTPAWAMTHKSCIQGGCCVNLQASRPARASSPCSLYDLGKWPCGPYNFEEELPYSCKFHALPESYSFLPPKRNVSVQRKCLHMSTFPSLDEAVIRTATKTHSSQSYSPLSQEVLAARYGLWCPTHPCSDPSKPLCWDHKTGHYLLYNMKNP